MTFDNELFRTRAADNQVEILSPRKASKEENSADSIADMLFRVVLGLRFRRRAEKQTEFVAKVLSSILDEKGEEALNGCVITSDRGYGRVHF